MSLTRWICYLSTLIQHSKREVEPVGMIHDLKQQQLSMFFLKWTCSFPSRLNTAVVSCLPSGHLVLYAHPALAFVQWLGHLNVEHHFGFFHQCLGKLVSCMIMHAQNERTSKIWQWNAAQNDDQNDVRTMTIFLVNSWVLTDRFSQRASKWLPVLLRKAAAPFFFAAACSVACFYFLNPFVISCPRTPNPQER